MSLSKEDRLRNADEALQLMLELLGNKIISTFEFDIDKPPFEGQAYPTTWKYLEDQGLIERRDTLADRRCALTGMGWLSGLQAIGAHRSPELTEQVGRIMSVLKNLVKGRQEMAFANAVAVAEEANVPVGLVYNIIDSHYILSVLGRIEAAWYETGGFLIEVPVDFGLEEL